MYRRAATRASTRGNLPLFLEEGVLIKRHGWDQPPASTNEATGCKKSLFTIDSFTSFVLTSTAALRPSNEATGCTKLLFTVDSFTFVSPLQYSCNHQDHQFSVS